jgi:hypothetical protein
MQLRTAGQTAWKTLALRPASFLDGHSRPHTRGVRRTCCSPRAFKSDLLLAAIAKEGFGTRVLVHTDSCGVVGRTLTSQSESNAVEE